MQTWFGGRWKDPDWKAMEGLNANYPMIPGFLQMFSERKMRVRVQ